MQPASGGFLEAVPLTSFVAMSLAGMGLRDHGIVRDAVGFLRSRAREGGSWPIDTNLATWVTTLSVSALAAGGSLQDRLAKADREAVRDWLLAQQHRERHPYTAAEPGGWAWTDLPGGVPDADDTAGALVALRLLARADTDARRAVVDGAAWLLGLQNADGGVPTFCRGWGALPFDRSAPDLTAHAIRAWSVWRDDLPDRLRRRVDRGIRRGLAFLARSQRGDGSWHPLWFGNEEAPEQANPTYGTARVVLALAACFSPGDGRAAGICGRGTDWLVAAQGEAGGWGGDRGVELSVEETAVAVEALAAVVTRADMEGAAAPPVDEARAAAERGLGWLVERAGGDDMPEAAPIGFYFASLWYFERLYPLVFTVAAMERASAAGLSPS
jgi:squalene-hopene/tetraprenyl-beta-curcumene cyclase